MTVKIWHLFGHSLGILNLSNSKYIIMIWLEPYFVWDEMNKQEYMKSSKWIPNKFLNTKWYLTLNCLKEDVHFTYPHFSAGYIFFFGCVISNINAGSGIRRHIWVHLLYCYVCLIRSRRYGVAYFEICNISKKCRDQ